MSVFYKLSRTPFFYLVVIAWIVVFMLSIAFVAEHFMHIKPCSLCLYQRYIVGILIVLTGYMMIQLSKRSLKTYLIYTLFLTLFSGFGLSSYHVGVEQKWWKGPDACQTQPLKVPDHASPAEKIKFLKHAMSQRVNVVRCDEINWKILGLSATLWTAFVYLILLWCAVRFMRIIKLIKGRE